MTNNNNVLVSNDDQLKIQETLFCFMRAFDDKDWNSMNECLAEMIDVDYSSSGVEKPSKISRNEYIEKRKANLADLKTLHNLTNLSVNCLNELTEVKCNYVIYRFRPEFNGSREHYFHSYGQYIFSLKHDHNRWKISSIIQKLLMNDGNPELHGATRR